MKWSLWLIATLVVAMTTLYGVAFADTASCAGKRSWQRDLVQHAVHGWFLGDPDPDDLVHLIQAEHGIAACAPRGSSPRRLHTATLPRGLELDEFGATLLANELEWRGLVSRPEDGLLGGRFRMRGPAELDDPHAADARE